MEPLVALLLELGARAKSAEARLVECDKIITEQNKKIEEFEKAAKLETIKE